MFMKKIYTLFLAFLFTVSLNAQWEQIKQPFVSGIAEYDNLVFTGTSVLMINEAGVYRSADNGLTWTLSVEGLDTTNTSVNEIVFISSRNEVWLVSNGGIYKSSDDGITWKKMELTGLSGNGWTNNIGRIGNRLIVTYSEWDSGLGTQVTKLCWSDDGETWHYGATVFTGWQGWIEFIHSFNQQFLGLIYEPNDGNPKKLYYSSNGTDLTLFPLTGLGTDPELDRDNFSVDPSGNYIFYRHRDQKKVYRFNNSLAQWEEKMEGIKPPTGYMLAEIFGVHSLGSHSFVSCLFTDMVNLMIRLYYSSDHGDNWTLVTDPGVDFPVFEDEMIIAGSGRLIGASFPGHIAYSDNNGQTWSPVTDINAGDFYNIVQLSNGNIFTKSPDQLAGVIKTSDNGNTWTKANGDLPNLLGIYFVESIFPGGPNIIYLAGRDNPFEDSQKLFKTTDNGDHWTLVPVTPVSEVIQFVGMHGAGNPIIYLGNEEGNGVYKYTTDQGTTWNEITGISSLGVDRVMGIKSNGSLMILFAEKSNKVRVYKSTNNGSNFTDITAELDGYQFEILVANRWDWRVHPSAVASFNYGGDQFVVAVVDNTNWMERKFSFYKLNDTQDGWTKCLADIPVPYNFDCLTLRHDGNYWYFVTTVGVYAIYGANPEKWLRIWNNEGYVMGIHPKSFLINNYGIFLGTQNAGLWRAQLTKPELQTLPVTNITEADATAGGKFVSTGGLPLYGKGFVFSTNPDPVIGGGPGVYTVGAGNSWDDYTATIFPLSPNTTYYVKAYATNSKGHGYGNQVSFTTLITGIVVNKPGEVNLYPNPSNGLFNIVADADMTMTVLNVIGKTVLTAPVYNGINTYELKNQPAGIYFVKLKGEGRQEQTIRLIIK